MSTTTAPAGTLSRRSDTPPADPLRFGILVWLTVLSATALLGLGLALGIGGVERFSADLAFWTGLVAIVNLLPVPKPRGVRLDMSLPLLLAAAFVFGPIPAGAAAFVGSMDPRELRRELPLLHSLFNRSQISLSVMAAAAVFGLPRAEVSDWPVVLLPALLALIVDTLVNYSLVGLALSSLTGAPWVEVLAQMRFGRPGQFAVTYASFGLTGLLLAQVYSGVGVWGLVVFVVPLILARQAFSHAQRVEEQAVALDVKERVLEKMASRIAEEQSDERFRIAASLHDDVLQALYNVTLHAQVIKEDLRSGWLLQLDEDVPGLLRASDDAGQALRDVIRDLRRSPIGRGGLDETLELLVSHLCEQTGARIETRVDVVDASPSVQLVAYQIAKEALTNAVKHAEARTISLHAVVEGDEVRVVVEDDGVGFVLNLVDTNRHFGVAMMRERAGIVGGFLQIDSRLGGGTIVSARLPRHEPDVRGK